MPAFFLAFLAIPGATRAQNPLSPGSKVPRMDPAMLARLIDENIQRRLQGEKIPCSERTEEFLRRVYLRGRRYLELGNPCLSNASRAGASYSPWFS